MKDAAAKNMNCIECHKGIAHELPNMAGGFRATYATLVNDAQEAPAAETLYNLGEKISMPANRAPTRSANCCLPPASTS